MPEIVKIKNTKRFGSIESYEGNGLYVVNIDDGEQKVLKERELDFVNCTPYPNKNYDVVKSLIIELNRLVREEYDTVNDENFFAYINRITGLSREEYNDVMK